jgi:hypothetical protein
MNLDRNARHQLKNFRLGSFVTALLVVAGIRELVSGLRGPVSIMLVYIINFLIMKAHWDAVPAQPRQFSWIADTAHLVGGIVLVAIGMKLGLWLHPIAHSSREHC